MVREIKREETPEETHFFDGLGDLWIKRCPTSVTRGSSQATSLRSSWPTVRELGGVLQKFSSPEEFRQEFEATLASRSPPAD